MSRDKVTIRAIEPEEVIRILSEANLIKSIKEMLNRAIAFDNESEGELLSD